MPWYLSWCTFTHTQNLKAVNDLQVWKCVFCRAVFEYFHLVFNSCFLKQLSPTVSIYLGIIPILALSGAARSLSEAAIHLQVFELQAFGFPDKCFIRPCCYCYSWWKMNCLSRSLRTRYWDLVWLQKCMWHLQTRVCAFLFGKNASKVIKMRSSFVPWQLCTMIRW